MAKYWKNANGYTMMLLDTTQGSRLLIFDENKHAMMCSNYEYWRKSHAAVDAEAFEKMACMQPVSQEEFYAGPLCPVEEQAA